MSIAFETGATRERDIRAPGMSLWVILEKTG